MSKLDQLIKELCPHGVEFKPIKDVYGRLRGTPITAKKMKEIENSNGDIRIFAGGKTVINAMKDSIPKANITTVPAVLVQSRGVIDFVYYEEPFTFKNEMWAYTTGEKDSVKFLYYVLSENRFFDYSTASAKGTKMPRGDKSAIMEYKVPDYCVPEQIQIANILSSLDDKIAFNKRINDNLLVMAA